MKLNALASEPQLVKITVDDAEIVARYGEPVDFWIYDRHDLPTFGRLAMLREENFAEVADLVLAMMRDESGAPMLAPGQTLPPDIMMRAIARVVESLGKSLAVSGETVTPA